MNYVRIEVAESTKYEEHDDSLFNIFEVNIIERYRN